MCPTLDPAIDPILLAALKGRLEQIADGMDATLSRSAFNAAIAKDHDAWHLTVGPDLPARVDRSENPIMGRKS